MSPGSEVPAALPSRQGACLRLLLGRLRDAPAVEVGVLVGSLAAGRGDAVSDIDLLVFVSEGTFDAMWSGRHEMHGPDAVACWDEVDPRRLGVGAFRWVGSDGVLVEMLIAEVGSGVRVASPAVVVVGDAAVFRRLPRRPPIRREELGRTPRHPVEAAYDTFKQVARAAGCHAEDGVDSPPR